MIKKEITDQGHKASGKLLESIEIVIEETPTGFIGKILMEDYSIILDRGVRAGNVPYRAGSGAKKSKYIDALIEWIKIIKPSLQAKERKSFAFAIAKTAKKQGHPTKGSFKYSKNKRRREWSKYAIDQNLESFEELLDLGKAVASAYASFDVTKVAVGT